MILSFNIIILNISGPNIETFHVINIYNKKSLDPEYKSTNYTVKRCLQNIQLSKETLIIEDFNAYHNWWNSSISNSIRSNFLISWLNSYDFDLINEPDIITRSSTINSIITQSVIDLAFATKSLFQQIADWYVDDLATIGSDHEIIKLYIRTKTTILINNSFYLEFFNFKKAN